MAKNNKIKRTLVRRMYPQVVLMLDTSRWFCTDIEHVSVLARPDSDILSHDKDSHTDSTNLRKWHREMGNKAMMRTVKVQAASM